MTEEMKQKIDNYIDTIFSDLDAHIEQTNFIVNKKSDSHKTKFEDTRIDMEVTNLINFEDGYTKRIVNLTTYDDEDRPITAGNICYKFDLTDKPDISKAKLTEFCNAIMEYSKNTDIIIRSEKSSMIDGEYARESINNIIDINGDIIEKKSVYSHSNSITEIREQYNNNLLDRTIEINENGKIITEYSYNEFKSLSSKKYTRYDRGNENIYKIDEIYDYDDQNRISRMNVIHKECKNDNEFKITEMYNIVYKYYILDGYDVRVETNINNPRENKIRIYGNNSNRYIEYNIGKRKVLVIDDTNASVGLTFSSDFKQIEVSHANIETGNRCLYYINDRYNNIDNLKYVKILENGNHVFSTEYKGRADHERIVKIVSTVFEENFNMEYSILFKITKDAIGLADMNINIG